MKPTAVQDGATAAAPSPQRTEHIRESWLDDTAPSCRCTPSPRGRERELRRERPRLRATTAVRRLAGVGRFGAHGTGSEALPA